MRKGDTALIGMILALVFIIVGLIGPWYSFSFLGISGSFGLFGAEIGGISTGYDQMGVYDRGPIDIIKFLTVIACIFTIIVIIAILGIKYNFGNVNTMSLIGGIFGIFTFLFSIIAVIYFMVLDTWESIGFLSKIGGPGYAWYMMIIAAIIALISSMTLFKKTSSPNMKLSE